MQRIRAYSNRLAVALGPAVLLVLGIGALLKPELVIDRFLWQYFWGPVVADAGGGTAVYNGVTAQPGYTLISEIGYGLALVYAVVLLVSVLRHFDVGHERTFPLLFTPFIAGGGLLRVLEDVSMHTGILSPPAQYFLISPIIYFTMFGIVFTTLLLGLGVDRYVKHVTYQQVLVAAGLLFALGVTAGLLQHSTVTVAWMFPATLGVAAAVLGVGYAASRFIAPVTTDVFTGVKSGVMYGHLLDASSTALSIAHLGYGEKHPIVAWAIELAGTAYVFIPLKLAVIGGILYYMTDEVRQDDPVFYNLIMLGIFAVGLGPGVRNMTRAVLGV